MAKSLYIASTESRAGKSLVSLAIIDLLLKGVSRVGFFRPIIGRKSSKPDKHIMLITDYFNLTQTYEESYGVTWDAASDLIGNGKNDELVEIVLQKYKALEEKVDFLVCEGTNFDYHNLAYETELNMEMAKNLSCPVLLLAKGKNKTVEEIINNIQVSYEVYDEKGCKVLGVVVNRVAKEMHQDLENILLKKFNHKIKYISALPEDPILMSPTVREIVDHLDAKVLLGQDQLSTQVYRFTVGAMNLDNFLERMSDHILILTPGDRVDIILGTLMAHNSKNFPSVAGIVCIGGILPGKRIMELLAGLPYTVPILLVETNSYETSTRLDDIHSQFNPEEPEKIYFALNKFKTYAKGDSLLDEIAVICPDAVTPKMFEYFITEKAKKQKQHIVLPEGKDERILKAANYLVNRGIVDITLLGDVDEIKINISKLGLNLGKVDIIDPLKSDKLEKYAKIFFQLREHKGVNMDVARDIMTDVSYFGTMMVYLGDADGMVSGAIHTTQHTIRPALQFIKTRPESKMVSSVFFMCLSDRVIVYGDCAINPNPDANLLAEIAISSADTAQKFGIEPRVAMLSYSSGESGQGEDVERVRKAVEIVRKKAPKLKVEGPIQYDAAVDLSVGQNKIPGSEVAGKATVLIFPDLNTGNNTYKAVQRETGAVAIGPVLQGLNKPVNDLSRGCEVPDIINTVIITSIQAQDK